MKKKLRVAILFGGKSAEHEISADIGRNIVEAMDKDKYEIVSIGIDKQGRWFFDEGARLLDRSGASHGEYQGRSESNGRAARSHTNTDDSTAPRRALGKVDVVFPVLHGPFGEDGTVQGLLKARQCSFRRCRSPGFRSGHGQGRDETTAARRQDTDRQISGF